MSLRHASKVLFRAAQAVRVATRQPAPTRVMPGAAKPGTAPAAHRQQSSVSGGGGGGGGMTAVSTEKAAALEAARRSRRAAEKAEKAVHLVCWGPN
jgi:hypothetical protein